MTKRNTCTTATRWTEEARANVLIHPIYADRLGAAKDAALKTCNREIPILQIACVFCVLTLDLQNAVHDS